MAELHYIYDDDDDGDDDDDDVCMYVCNEIQILPDVRNFTLGKFRFRAHR